MPQKIDTFEHVLAVRGPQTARTQPSSQRDMLQALANPRTRIFLVFLDGPFVDDVHARAINEPLIKFLSTELADDDLVAVMTPNMSASQVTFGKKTEVIAEAVRTAWWSWGRQNKELDPELDKRQIQYTLVLPEHRRAGEDDRPEPRTEHARGVAGRGQLPGERSRGAESDHRRHRRVAAISRGPGPDAPARDQGGAARRRQDPRRPDRQAHARGYQEPRTTRSVRRSATASAPIWRASTTTSSCARSSTTRIAATAAST